MDQTTIPFLPGMGSYNPPRQSYHKSQLFDVTDGIRVNKNSDLIADRSWRPVDSEPDLSISKRSAEYDATQVMNKTTANMRNLPSWVAYDRKVVRFFGYFKEAVFSSQIEDYRCRRCVVYYYLNDHSMHIAEPKIENSGIPQGVFIKRHRIPKSNNEFVTLNDLAIGAELSIYGRVFRLVDCDEFTRHFFMQNGIDLGEPEEIPLDPFTKKHTEQLVVHNKLMHPMKEHMEASLGKMMGVDILATQKFLKNDGKVLRFYVIWEDNKMYGELRPYVLHYFLADDTIEILEIAQANSGRDSFPVFLQRGRVPKNYKEARADISQVTSANDQSVQYYTEEDFRVGSCVIVYGREFFICGADNFTKDFYKTNYGLTDDDFPYLSMDDPKPEPTIMAPPKANGFGSEEDSLGSFLYLMPKIPKIDFKKLMTLNGCNLSFLAKFVDPAPEDVDRRFNVTFFMNDDTVKVFERFHRNSGFIGGKFLERTRMFNPATELNFAPKDFFVGAELEINKFKFKLLEADEWTRKFMEKNNNFQ